MGAFSALVFLVAESYLAASRNTVFFMFLRTYDTFPTFSLEKFFQPPPFEEFLEIDFQFSMVSILHM
jgi:hypothetical protein